MSHDDRGAGPPKTETPSPDPKPDDRSAGKTLVDHLVDAASKAVHDSMASPLSSRRKD